MTQWRPRPRKWRSDGGGTSSCDEGGSSATGFDTKELRNVHNPFMAAAGAFPVHAGILNARSHHLCREDPECVAFIDPLSLLQSPFCPRAPLPGVRPRREMHHALLLAAASWSLAGRP